MNNCFSATATYTSVEEGEEWRKGEGGNARWKFAIETSVAANTFGRQTRALSSPPWGLTRFSLSFRMTINAEGEEKLSRFEDIAEEHHVAVNLGRHRHPTTTPKVPLPPDGWADAVTWVMSE